MVKGKGRAVIQVAILFVFCLVVKALSLQLFTIIIDRLDGFGAPPPRKCSMLKSYFWGGAYVATQLTMQRHSIWRRD
jgi:hypothetical protein